MTKQETFIRDCITALRNSPSPKAFTMHFYYHFFPPLECGSPACVLGHYYFAKGSDQRVLLCDRAYRESGLEWREICQLFGADGCGGARTIAKAIEYLEAFCARKWPRRTDAELVADLKKKIMPVEEEVPA